MSSVPRVVLLLSPVFGYERGLLRGIARYVRHYGPWTLFLAGQQAGVPLPAIYNLAESHDENGRRKNRRNLSGQLDLAGLGATGIIGRIDTAEVADAVLASGLPTVAMDLTDQQLSPEHPLSRASEIRPDSYRAGKLAAEHLLERGFRRFAFCGEPRANWSRYRRDGFVDRLREAGFDCDLFQDRSSKKAILSYPTQAALTQWLTALQKPIGVLACNDDVGRLVIEASTLAGFQVPNDVAVVGVDEDRLLSELSNPPLSSVAWNTEAGGYQAAELLSRMMSNKTRQQRLILVEPLWVVARASSDMIAVEDREVRAAMVFIRENARRPIGVNDVVKHTDTSRRALEIRFHRTLGRSIREEIERIRLEWVKRLLLETDLPMRKIAKAAGFSSQSYMNKVFHSTAGVTLTRYRRDRSGV